MRGLESQTGLFEAYHNTAQDILPPGFLLAGERIIQSIGNVRQLFSCPLPSALSSIQQLPEGDVKSKLLKLVDSFSLGVPATSCSTDGVRVTAVDNANFEKQLLVVFDLTRPNGPKTSVTSAQLDKLELSDPEIVTYETFFHHRVGAQQTPRMMLWETDLQGRATSICEHEIEFVGSPRKDLLGLGWVKSVHPDDVDQYMDTYQQAIERGEPFCLSSRRRRFDGEYFWFKTHGVPQFDSQNTLVSYKGFCLDCTHQLEVQTALSTHQRMMFSLLENCPFMVAYVDRDLEYLYVNNNYAEFWHVERDQIIGNRVPDLTGNFFETLKPYLDRTLLGETVYYDEIVFPNKTATESRWLEITHVPAFDANETVIGFYCFVNDATDSRKHERLLQLVLSHAPAMILLLDTDLDVLHANFQFMHRLVKPGITVDDNSLCEVVGRESFSELTEHLALALAGQECSCEARLNSADGTSIDVFAKFVPEFDDEKNIIGICGLMLDISELKTAQSDLQRSEARFELAVAGSSLGIIEFDSDQPDWVFADHVEDLLDFDRGELNNSRAQIRALIHPDDREKNSTSNSFIQNGRKSKLELRLKNKAGQYRWFDVFSQYSCPTEGKPGRLVGTIVDIDELKTAQLESAAQVRRRDEFLAMLSHELRNPMAAIVLAMDVLQGSKSVPADVLPVVDIMMRRTEQISRLLDDLLDVSRVTHNRIEFKKIIHDINLSVIEVADSFLSSARQNQQALHLEICQQPSMIEGDESRLKQVITNLIENAIKYSPENSDIWVSTKNVDGNVLISVRDTGVGIAPELIGHIFDLFFQGESTLDRKSGGMGVGLFMVNHIVSAHEGVTIATSDGPGSGSQFEVCLPLSVEAPVPAEITGTTLFDRLNVVLVEDNRDTRTLAARLLKQRGFSVTEFADGESASQSIPEIRPEIAIIDIGLPGKSGLDLAREFRRNDRLDSTMLIALTGYGQESDKQRVAAAGFDLHLVKPVDIDALTDAIAHWSSNQPVAK